MSHRGKPGNTALLQAADLPDERWVQRIVRLLFRQRPLQVMRADAQTAANPHTFCATEEGSGSFGRWVLDEAGLPAYEYEIDQYRDPRAYYRNTEGRDRRDHWHQIGNHRITALASNDGTVQVYTCDRGGVFLNRFEAWDDQRHAGRWLLVLVQAAQSFIRLLARRRKSRVDGLSPLTMVAQAAGVAVRDPSGSPVAPPRGAASPEVLMQIIQQNVSAQGAPAASNERTRPAAGRYAYAGGYGYVSDGVETWATAFRYRPRGAKTRRVFGTGYFETETLYRNIRISRRLYAPWVGSDERYSLADEPMLLIDVDIQNTGSQPVELRHYEYWDVNVHQLQLEWLRSGLFARANDEVRQAVNRYFKPQIEWDSTSCMLRFSQRLTQPPPAHSLPPNEASDIDWEPATVFLIDLEGGSDGCFVRKASFFGRGDARQPEAVIMGHPTESVSDESPGDPMPYCLVLQQRLQLQPGESRRLRFAYGLIRAGQSIAFVDQYRQPLDFWRRSLEGWKSNLAYFWTGSDPVLQRETAWHAYYLSSATVYSAYHGLHLVPQGSAYLYLHGADGAPRDQSLFVLPMTYLQPALARDMLRLIMRLTDGQTGQISYAFAGHGFLSNGLNVHTNPSDLDLFFLLALCEYLAATGDMAFLDEEVPFYPPNEPPSVADGMTVLDHVRTAVHHLFEGVGIGEHGLVKVRSGDWSDSIVLETALRDGLGPFGVTYQNSKQNGESVPNTQMTLYVLPLLAALLRQRDPELVAYINGSNRLGDLRAALRRQWNPNGWFNRAILRGFTNNPIVIDRFDLEAQPWALISGLAADMGTESALIEQIDQVLDRPSPIGASLTEGGMVWPAISQLLTWAYVRCKRPDLAWRSLNRHTFAVHAHVYPNIWFNIWSGPDGINGLKSDMPGGTWASPLTPMTDFPVMNANQHAMALLGLLRVCGIEPAPEGDGLTIHPQVPREQFMLDLPLIRLEKMPGRIAGQYRPFVDGTCALYVHVPEGMAGVMVWIDNRPQPDVEILQGRVRVPLVFTAGQVVDFAVQWTA